MSTEYGYATTDDGRLVWLSPSPDLDLTVSEVSPGEGWMPATPELLTEAGFVQTGPDTWARYPGFIPPPTPEPGLPDATRAGWDDIYAAAMAVIAPHGDPATIEALPRWLLIPAINAAVDAATAHLSSTVEHGVDLEDGTGVRVTPESWVDSHLKAGGVPLPLYKRTVTRTPWEPT